MYSVTVTDCLLLYVPSFLETKIFLSSQEWSPTPPIWRTANWQYLKCSTAQCKTLDWQCLMRCLIELRLARCIFPPLSVSPYPALYSLLQGSNNLHTVQHLHPPLSWLGTTYYFSNDALHAQPLNTLHSSYQKYTAEYYSTLIYKLIDILITVNGWRFCIFTVFYSFSDQYYLSNWLVSQLV